MNFGLTSNDLPANNQYPKLIRDEVPQIIADNDGKQPEIRKLTDNTEFLVYLLKKIIEEAKELSQAPTDSKLVEEVADIYEAVDELLKLKGISRGDIIAAQEEKRAKRGGYQKRLLMLHND